MAMARKAGCGRNARIAPADSVPLDPLATTLKSHADPRRIAFTKRTAMTMSRPAE
jgi:hypothetical protein